MWSAGSPTRDQTHVPCIAGQILYHWTTREVALTISFFPASPATFRSLSVTPTSIVATHEAGLGRGKARLRSFLPFFKQAVNKGLALWWQRDCGLIPTQDCGVNHGGTAQPSRSCLMTPACNWLQSLVDWESASSGVGQESCWGRVRMDQCLQGDELVFLLQWPGQCCLPGPREGW